MQSCWTDFFCGVPHFEDLPSALVDKEMMMALMSGRGMRMFPAEVTQNSVLFMGNHADTKSTLRPCEEAEFHYFIELNLWATTEAAICRPSEFQ
jgi:hypothetical protein